MKRQRHLRKRLDEARHELEMEPDTRSRMRLEARQRRLTRSLRVTERRYRKIVTRTR
jgi:hypothetical protein